MSLSAPIPRKRFAAVILAAGASRRMGRPKALLDVGGRPLLAHLVDTFQQSRLLETVAVVTGHQPEQIEQALGGFDVTIFHNAAYESGGMLSSVKTGVRGVANRCEAFFLALLDQPLVTAQTLTAMIRAWTSDQPAIVVPAHDGKRGHPILISARCADEILSQSPDKTLRDFVAQHRNNTAVVEVSDAGVLSCLDTPSDYQLVLNLWRTLTCPTVSAEPA